VQSLVVAMVAWGFYTDQYLSSYEEAMKVIDHQRTMMLGYTKVHYPTPEDEPTPRKSIFRLYRSL